MRKSMVRTVIVARDLDFDYSKERWSGQKERIGCALKIETVSRNKWRKCKMPFLSGHHYFLRLCVPVIYTPRLQSKIATGKRSLSHRAFSSTAFPCKWTCIFCSIHARLLGLFRGDGAAFSSASYFTKYREKRDCNRFFVYANLSGVNSYD